ncbi:hypothetical protein DFO77_12516 [Marinilabilia salmonicolor]|jgi:hypothetical protein|uniref:Uncharacterized protein n=1 Tax=Marinilabilia salmonicolor TaxID=989 RepID=A0A368UMA9_9BACT|nr:hypothetical protein DFO77_12516 [Marinilabilia salmonicolor]
MAGNVLNSYYSKGFSYKLQAKDIKWVVFNR